MLGNYQDEITTKFAWKRVRYGPDSNAIFALQAPELMGEAGFKKILRVNHVFLKDRLDIDGKLLDYLYQEDVMTEEECEKCRCPQTKRERCQCLLSTLPRKGVDGYKTFCTVLAILQPDIKVKLDCTAVEKGVNGLVFVNKSELEAELQGEFNQILAQKNQMLAQKDEEMKSLRQANRKKTEDLEKALRQQDSLRSQITAANKETRDLRHRYQMMRKGIGGTDLWLKDSDEEEKLLLCPTLTQDTISVQMNEKERISRNPQAWVPFNLELPQCPIYLETKVEAEVELGPKLVFGPDLLELGLYEDCLDITGNTEQKQSPTWGIRVALCPRHHFGVCTQVLAEGEHLLCSRTSTPCLPGMRTTLNFGFVMDAGRGKLGFIDINRDEVLCKFDIDFQESLYQMFAFRAKPDAGAKVKMAVTSGSQIVMDKQKQDLILQILH